jgi:hypothetical protein
MLSMSLSGFIADVELFTMMFSGFIADVEHEFERVYC